MHLFSQTGSIEFLDIISCALLAGACFTRAQIFRANPLGSLILAVFCGLTAPLLREILMHGQQGAKLVLLTLPGWAFAGGLAAMLICRLVRGRISIFFFWLDALAVALVCAFYSCLAAPETGATVALTLTLVCGLLPGLLRDAALGDCAIFVEKPWYAAGALSAAIVALAVILLPAFFRLPGFFVEWLGEWACGLGMLAAIAIRWRAGCNEE